MTAGCGPCGIGCAGSEDRAPTPFVSSRSTSMARTLKSSGWRISKRALVQNPSTRKTVPGSRQQTGGSPEMFRPSIPPPQKRAKAEGASTECTASNLATTRASGNLARIAPKAGTGQPSRGQRLPRVKTMNTSSVLTCHPRCPPSRKANVHPYCPPVGFSRWQRGHVAKKTEPPQRLSPS